MQEHNITEEKISDTAWALVVAKELRTQVKLMKTVAAYSGGEGFKDKNPPEAYAYVANLAALGMAYAARCQGHIGYLLGRYASDAETLLLSAFSGYSPEVIKELHGPITKEDAERCLLVWGDTINDETIKTCLNDLREAEDALRGFSLMPPAREWINERIVGLPVPMIPATPAGRIGMFEHTWKGGLGSNKKKMN